MTFRTERDPLGELNVPADAYYGVQTARAVENFRISDLRAPFDLVTATILIKKAAAEANRDLGRLDAVVANAIVSAADEILSGRLRDQFVVDIYQAGAGTSHNMNANEVLANRAGELLGEARGTYQRVHPNDHVNMGQSTNDVFPAATRLALLLGHGRLIDAARDLVDALQRKADEFADILKTGRTHLQDAVPITLGQEFGGYAACIRRGADDVDQACTQLLELNIGATAVGTGLNAGDDYRQKVIEYLCNVHRPRLEKPPTICFASRKAWATCSPTRVRCGGWPSSLSKIANDLRLLSMGPRAGLSEIALPAVQPGSSIMPGKVNPSVPEMVNQVCFQVIGCDTTVAMACEAGQLELNVMMPVIAWNALHSSTILHHAMNTLRLRTIDGIVADAARARELLDRSTATATALSPYIGYAATAEIAKEAVKSGKSIRDLVLARGLLDEKRLDEILSVEAMTRGGIAGRAGQAGGQDRRERQERRERGSNSDDIRAGALVAAVVFSPALPARPALPGLPALPAASSPSCPVGSAAGASGAIRAQEAAVCSPRRISACSKRPIATTGTSRNRSWTRSASPTARWSRISALAAAGWRFAWRAAWARTASSTRKTSSRR